MKFILWTLLHFACLASAPILWPVLVIVNIIACAETSRTNRKQRDIEIGVARALEKHRGF